MSPGDDSVPLMPGIVEVLRERAREIPHEQWLDEVRWIGDMLHDIRQAHWAAERAAVERGRRP